jgi:hypothetical protein
MIYEEINSESRTRRTLTGAARILFALKIDGPLVTGLALIALYGLVVLYSASGQSVATILRTVGRFALGTLAMLLLARVNPNFLRRTTPWLYILGVFLLVVVAVFGHVGLGAQRWLSLGFHPLPALRADEARRPHDVRLVPARAPVAAELHIAGGVGGPDCRTCWPRRG